MNLTYITLTIAITLFSTKNFASNISHENLYQNLIKIDLLNKDIESNRNSLLNEKNSQQSRTDDIFEIQYIEKINNSQNKIRSLTETNYSLARSIESDIIKSSQPNHFKSNFRTELTDEQDLYIYDLSNYHPTYENGFYYKDSFTNNIKLNLKIVDSHSVKEKYKININCDGPFKYKNLLKSKKAKIKKSLFQVNSSIYPQKDVINSKLYLNKLSGNCQVKIKGHSRPVTFFIKKENNYVNQLKLPGPKQIALCYNKKKFDTDSTTHQFFNNLTGNYISCQEEIEHIKILDDGLASIQEKIKLLLGTTLSLKQIRDLRINSGLIDFSNAPKLDAIFISYLTFVNDTSGSLILKLLNYHAQNGTQIRIIVSNKSPTNKKDNLALLKFKDKYPNAEVQLFKSKNGFHPKSFRKVINPLHRVNHIKMFMTYSKSEVNNNQLIMGGRNLRDLYHFKDTSISENKLYYSDFEYKITSAKLIKSLAHKFFKFWSNYRTSFYVPPSHLHFSDKSNFSSYNSNSIYIKNQFSYPTFDQNILEDKYVQLFDSAQNSITIVTPYLHLSSALTNSLYQAVQRGINITIVTRLNLTGDTLGQFLSEVNSGSVNNLLNKVKLYEFYEDNIILHSKIILVDNDLTVLGSVNLNRRSFLHDTENVSYILSNQVSTQVRQVVNTYIQRSRPINEKVSSNLFYKAIVKIFSDVF